VPAPFASRPALPGARGSAEEVKGFRGGGPKLVPLSGENGDRVTDYHIADFSFDTDSTGPVGDEGDEGEFASDFQGNSSWAP